MKGNEHNIAVEIQEEVKEEYKIDNKDRAHMNFELVENNLENVQHTFLINCNNGTFVVGGEYNYIRQYSSTDLKNY